MTRSKPKMNKRSKAMVTTNGVPRRAQLSTQTKRGAPPKPAGAVSFNNRVTPLPRSYVKFADTVSMRVRGSANIYNSAAGIASVLVSLSPTTFSTPGYFGLGNYFPILLGLIPSYSRFMISHASVTLVPITPITDGGYVAIGYEPDNTSTSIPPATLTDVTTAIHSDVAQVTEMASIEFNPAEYFNDWRLTEANAGGVNALQQAGLIQVWCTNARAVSNGVAVLQMEFDVHLSGLRSTS